MATGDGWLSWRPDPATSPGEVRATVRTKIESAARLESEIRSDIAELCRELELEIADTDPETVEQARRRRVLDAGATADSDTFFEAFGHNGVLVAAVERLEAARGYLARVCEAATVLAARDVLAAEHAAPIGEGVGVVVRPGARPRVVVAAPAAELSRVLEDAGLSPEALAAQGISVDYREVRVDRHGGEQVTERLVDSDRQRTDEVSYRDFYTDRAVRAWMEGLADVRPFGRVVADAIASGDLRRESLLLDGWLATQQVEFADGTLLAHTRVDDPRQVEVAKAAALLAAACDVEPGQLQADPDSLGFYQLFHPGTAERELRDLHLGRWRAHYDSTAGKRLGLLEALLDLPAVPPPGSSARIRH